jgi:hypothetical protein
MSSCEDVSPTSGDTGDIAKSRCCRAVDTQVIDELFDPHADLFRIHQHNSKIQPETTIDRLKLKNRR